MSQNPRNNTNNNDDDTADYWAAGVLAGLGALAIGAGAYYMCSSSDAEKEKKQKEERLREEARQREHARLREEARQREEARNQGGNLMWNLFTDVLQTTGNLIQAHSYSPAAVVPDDPVITNLNSLVHDIYVRFIALKDNDFEEYYNVFKNVFYKLHERMKEADKYYNQYSSTVQFAGSHFDGLRINKPDEFDMDIIIRLPVNLREDRVDPSKSDIVLENKAPGYVQLKAGKQFQNLPERDKANWEVNKTAYRWMDDRKYILRSGFIYWFQGVVNRALNKFEMHPNGRRVMFVDGVPYALRLTASGPAITLIIENHEKKFRCDVDLVPALKFPEERWPICRGYRKVPDRCKKDIFMVVPKPMKGGLSPHDTDRSWRLAMHLQEKDLMYGTENMRQAIRLIKKLRDSLGLNKIASYYIKTMFYHVAMEKDDAMFWRNNPAFLFTYMVKKFRECLEKGEIPYFWNKDNNLIGHIDRATLTGYANKLKALIPILEDKSQYKFAAKYLLTESEFKWYNDKFLHI